VKNLSEVSQGKAQLGLGHSYSRAKVKFNVNRADNMIIQAISLLDQLDKDVNTFSMRIRLVLSFIILEISLTSNFTCIISLHLMQTIVLFKFVNLKFVFFELTDFNV
jgi:RNA processing factor Prp31